MWGDSVAYKDSKQGEQYRNNYTKAAYDRLSILPSRAEGATIRAAANAAGESVSAYILEAVRQRMQREQQAQQLDNKE